MSRIASIHIALYHQVPMASVLSVWMNSHWMLGSGRIAYLPLGDDTFDWQSNDMDAWPRVQEIMQEKERRKEVVGLGLRLRDSDMGATFHFYPDGQIMILLDADRPRLAGAEEYTDMGWMLARLLPPLVQAGHGIESVECRDHG